MPQEIDDVERRLRQIEIGRGPSPFVEQCHGGLEVTARRLQPSGGDEPCGHELGGAALATHVPALVEQFLRLRDPVLLVQ